MPTDQNIAVNAYETEEALVLVAACPGVQPADVTVEVADGSIDLRAALRSDPPKDYLIEEWSYGSYERTLELPVPAGLPGTAVLGNGQLVVSLTKGSERGGSLDVAAA